MFVHDTEVKIAKWKSAQRLKNTYNLYGSAYNPNVKSGKQNCF